VYRYKKTAGATHQVDVSSRLPILLSQPQMVHPSHLVLHHPTASPKSALPCRRRIQDPLCSPFAGHASECEAVPTSVPIAVSAGGWIPSQPPSHGTHHVFSTASLTTLHHNQRNVVQHAHRLLSGSFVGLHHRHHHPILPKNLSLRFQGDVADRAPGQRMLPRRRFLLEHPHWLQPFLDLPAHRPHNRHRRAL
jgi:hypothetical protein